MDTPTAAKHFGAFAAFIGFIAGILYAGVGLAIDASTGNLGGGTALAFLAIPGMPFFFLPVGVIGGILWAPLCRRLPRRFGGCDEPAP